MRPCAAASHGVIVPCADVPSIPNSSMSDSTALTPTPIQIGQCDLPFSHCAPKNPAMTAPISGSSGIR